MEFKSGPERNKKYQFLHLQCILFPVPGELNNTETFNFSFPTVSKPHESYSGLTVSVKYFLQFTCTRSLAADIMQKKEVWVMQYEAPPEIMNPIKLEVGIEDCLHIEYEFARNKFHLDDAIVGKVYFLLLRVPLKYMGIELLKKEYTGTDKEVSMDAIKMGGFELMDGTPSRGESIPIRIFLSYFDELTPTYTGPSLKFQVRYFLNLVLVDGEERKYFKQSEIILWRGYPSPLLYTEALNESSLYTACSTTTL